MLYQRILTALILIPLVVAGVLWLPTWQFALVLAVVVVAGGWEWSQLAGLDSGGARVTLLGALTVWLGLLWMQMSGPLVPGYLLLVTVFWFASGTWLWRVQSIPSAQGPSLRQAFVGLLVLGAAWSALVALHRLPGSGPALVLFSLVLVWVADTAAFFAGRRWGRSKLAPLVSPGKTWAGVWGAVAGAMACGLVLAVWHSAEGLAIAASVLLCVATALVSIVGDLYESYLKRQRGLKDSGHLLPGHGGILDRIDSLIAAAPIFATGLLWLERVG